MSRKVHLPAVSSITFVNLSKFTEKWKLQTKFPLKKVKAVSWGLYKLEKISSRFFPKTKMAKDIIRQEPCTVFPLKMRFHLFGICCWGRPNSGPCTHNLSIWKLRLGNDANDSFQKGSISGVCNCTRLDNTAKYGASFGTQITRFGEEILLRRIFVIGCFHVRVKWREFVTNFPLGILGFASHARTPFPLNRGRAA